jgi:ABC-type glycerol-3-phosphate transport system permease component
MYVIELVAKGLTTLFLAAGAVVIMIPLAFMLSTSLKDPAQLRSDSNTLIPRKLVMQPLNGDVYPEYTVTTPTGTRTMVMLKKAPGGNAIFVDPSQPTTQVTLPLAAQQAHYQLDIHWDNYPSAVQALPFVLLLTNLILANSIAIIIN